MINFFILVFLSLLLFFTSLKIKVNNKIIVYIYIFVVALLASYRSEGIPDTIAYKEFYGSLGRNLIQNINLTYFEPGFVTLATFIKLIVGNNHQIFFFVITFLNLTLIYKSIRLFYKYEIDQTLYVKVSIKYVVPLVLYVFTFGYVFNFITMRAGLAFSFLFLALAYFKVNNKKSILFFIIALNFHNAIIIITTILPFLIWKIKLKRYIYIVWLIFIPFFYFLGISSIYIDFMFFIVKEIPIIYERFFPYIGDESIVNGLGSSLRIAIFFILGIILLIGYRGSLKYSFILTSYFFGLTINCLFINLAVVGRISEIFMAFVFILPGLYLNYKKYTLKYFFILIFILIYFIISNFRISGY